MEKRKKERRAGERRALPGWQEMIDHISETWQKKRLADFGYPFTGKDFADLRYFASRFQTWTLAALWDEYLEGANEYVDKHACDIFTFTRSLPRLMDSRSYKSRAAGYEKRWAPPLPSEIVDLFSGFNLNNSLGPNNPPKSGRT